MTLYLVVNNDANGENQDLFVNADTPDNAVIEMLGYYEAEYSDFDTPFRVFAVPTETRFPLSKGPIEWPEPVYVELK